MIKKSQPEKPQTYVLTIEIAQGSVIMNFTDRNMANQEYQRIQSQGIYQGSWIKHIELKDSHYE